MKTFYLEDPEKMFVYFYESPRPPGDQPSDEPHPRTKPNNPYS